MDKKSIGLNFFIPMPDNCYSNPAKYAGDAWNAGKNQIKKGTNKLKMDGK
jgi:hypothetical protein